MSAPESRSAVVLALAEEFLERYRQGQRPSLKEYIERYPELAAEIKVVFPAMALILENISLADEPLDGDATGPERAAENAPPAQLGDFRILREVGRGGMGIVYEAEQMSLGRHVALKVMPRNLFVDASQRCRFEREARAAARLHHTNIVPVFGVGEHEGMPYYVMQFIQGLGLNEVLEELKRMQGGSLPNFPSALEAPTVLHANVAAENMARSLLTGAFQISRDYAELVEPGTNAQCSTGSVNTRCQLSGSFTLPSAVKLPGSSGALSGGQDKTASYWQSVAHIGVQVARALEYAHHRGIQHRDIKPSNLLLDTRGTVWVTDFGLARAEDEDRLTLTGDLVGTLRYMPPEAFEGRSDKRSDIYSLGLTLYEMLAFQPAFADKDRHQLIKRVTTEEPARLDKFNPSIPRDLATILHKAIEPEPSRRYQTAGELAADLQRFLADEPIQARRVSVAERAGRWCRHNPALAALTMALIVVFLIGFAGVAWKWREAEEQRAIAVEHADRATREAEQSRHLLYAADLSLTQQAWEVGDLGRALALLERQRPPIGQEEFEWRYLRQLCRDGSRQTWRGHNGEVIGLTLTKDGRTLATCGSEVDQSVCIWDVTSPRHIKLLQRDVKTLTFAPDGTTLALSQEIGQMVQLWDPLARRVVAFFPTPSRVYSVTFSPDSSLLAAGCSESIRVWDVAMRRELELDPAAQPKGRVTAVAFSPDGRTLASAGENGTGQLWDVVARRVRARFQGHSSTVTSLSFSPDGKTLASASWDTTVRFWDAATGQSASTLLRGSRTIVNAVSFSPDGKTLATGSEDGTIRIRDAATKETLVLLRGHTGPVTAVAFTSDGRSLFSASRDGTLKAWDVAPGPDANILTPSMGTVSSVAFSPDGKTLAIAGSGDKTVQLWDLASRKLVHRLRGHKAPVLRVTYAPDGQTLASTGFDRMVRLWDTATGQPVCGFPCKDPANSCAFSPDGKLLAASLWGSEKVLVWDIPDRRLTRQLSGSYVHFSPDGALLAAALGNTVQLWEVATWQALPPVTGFATPVRCLAFAPDGKSLAACEADGMVRLWDLVGKRQVANRRGNSSAIESVTFSPNGRRLATAGGDSTVKLWDVSLLRDVATLTGHDGPILAAAFSPDGNTLASASADATVRLWQAPPETLHQAAEAPGALPPLEVLHLFALEVLDKARATLTNSANAQRVEVTAQGDFKYSVQLVQVFDDLQEGATYTIRFRAKADAPRRLGVLGQIAVPNWHRIGLNQDIALTETWQNYELQFQASGLAALNKIAFLLGEQTGTVWIADFTLTASAK